MVPPTCMENTRVQGNSHVRRNAIRSAVSVVVCQVIDGADSHDCLPDRVDNGQGDNGPVIKRGDKFLYTLTITGAYIHIIIADFCLFRRHLTKKHNQQI